MTMRPDRPLRVVQVSFHADKLARDSETLLGVWPTLSSVAAGVSRANVDVTVVQTAHATETLLRNSVAYQFVNDATSVRRSVIAWVRSLAPDVIHVHGFHHLRAIGRLARTCPGTPMLIQDHGALPPTGWRSSAWRWALTPTAGVAFTARDQAAPFIAARTLRRDVRVFEVLEGSSTFTPGDRDTARRETGMHGDPCLLWVGRLDANKDPLTMLAAVELAAEQLPGLRLWCCYGKAPLLHVVKARVAESSILRERVALLGTLPSNEMERRFRAADIYVQASHREGSGYALLEAMACGTPPVVCDIPAARRIVGDAGLLAPVGDASALADAIVRSWNANSSAARCAVRKRFESALTFDAIGRELRDAYQCLVQ